MEVNSAEEVWKSGNGRGQEQKLRVVYSKDNNNQQNFKEPQQQLEKSGLNRGSNISSTVNSNELFVSMVGRNSEVGAVTSSVFIDIMYFWWVIYIFYRS